ncbi:Uncharacterised protein [uncultured archaeon]|nr:Uncharacterised protein [uncultured archaeon]
MKSPIPTTKNNVVREAGLKVGELGKDVLNFATANPGKTAAGVAFVAKLLTPDVASAQDPSIVNITRVDGAINKVIPFEGGTYNIVGTSSTVTKTMSLDSVYLCQTVDLNSSSSFKFFGNLEVKVAGYDNGVLTLKPVKSAYGTIQIQNGDKHGEWTFEVAEQSASVLKLRAVATNQTVKQGDTLRGPAGSIDLTNVPSPAYTQAIIRSISNTTIPTDQGDVTIANGFKIQIVRDSLAKNPVKNDFYVLNGSGTTVIGEFVVDPGTKKGYYKDTTGTTEFKKNSTPAVSISATNAINAAGKSADSKPIVQHSIKFDNTSSDRLMFAIQNGEIVSQTFDLVHSTIKGTTVIDSLMQSGLLSYLDPVSNFKDTVVTGQNGKLEVVIAYNGNDPRNNVQLVLGKPDSSVTDVREGPAGAIHADIRVYPNPIADRVMNVELPQAVEKDRKFYIYTQLGQQVGEFTIPAGEQVGHVFLKDLSTGTYFVTDGKRGLPIVVFDN